MAYNFDRILSSDNKYFVGIEGNGTTAARVLGFVAYTSDMSGYAKIFSSSDTVKLLLGDGSTTTTFTASKQGKTKQYYSSAYAQPKTTTEYTTGQVITSSSLDVSGYMITPVVPVGLSLGIYATSGAYSQLTLVNIVDGVINDVPKGVYTVNYTDETGTAQEITLDEITANVRFYMKGNISVDFTKQVTITQSSSPVEPTITNNVSNTDVDYTGENPFVLTLVAQDGYKFGTSPVAQYINEDGEIQQDTFQLSSDNKTATLTTATLDSSNLSITIDGATIPETVEPTITNNIANSTASYTGSDHQYIITVKAYDGYLFSGDIEASYTGYSSDAPVSVSFVVSSDNKTASGVCPDVDENTPIVLTGETVVETVITVVNNITGTTETHTFDGTNFAVTVKGTAYKMRFHNAQMTYTDTDGYEQTTDLSTSIVDNIPQADGTAQVKNGTSVTLTGTYEQVTLVTSELSNCTVAETLPDVLYTGDSLTVTVNANKGTVFETCPTFSYDNKDGDYVAQELTLSEDTKTATGTFVVPSDYVPQSVTLYANAVPEKVIGTNYGTINVYKVTLDNLEAFSKKRFFKEAINSDGTEFTLINLGNYVNRLKRVFFNVPVASTDVIKCGNYNTGVECEAPDTDTVTLNFGSITIPSPNGDVTDYQSEIQLFVPFKGYVTLPVKYIGKTITLTYTINVITGGGVAKVLCGDDVVLLLDVEPNEDILYQTNLDNLATIGGDTWNEELLYGIEPYLYMMYYNSLNKTARNNDYENAKLGDLSGFCVVDDVTLSTTAEMTANEQESIISLLKQGVYIEQ